MVLLSRELWREEHQLNQEVRRLGDELQLKDRELRSAIGKVCYCFFFVNKLSDRSF